MPDVNVVLTDVTTPQGLYSLRTYIRTLFKLFDPRVSTTAYAASIVVDASQAETFFITLTGNITGITIKNGSTGRKLKFIFLQDGVGGRTVSGWPATALLSGASFTVTTNANRYSTISFEYINSKWVEVGRTLDVR